MPPRRLPESLQQLSASAVVKLLCSALDDNELLRKAGLHVEAQKRTVALRRYFSLIPAATLAAILERFNYMFWTQLQEGDAFPAAAAILLQPTMTHVSVGLWRKPMKRELRSGFARSFGPDRAVYRKMMPVLKCAIATMTNLTSLQLFRHATNELLLLVARSCPHLEDLKLALATEVDDRGLQLFGVKDQEGVHGCLKLSKLGLTACQGRITPTAVARLIKDLPDLKELDYERIWSALEHLRCERRRGQRTRSGGSRAAPTVFKLTRLRETPFQDYFDPTQASIDFVVISCPAIESVDLKIRPASLVKTLARFSKLHTVFLEIEQNLDGKAFRAFCKGIGDTLKNLKLSCTELTDYWPACLRALGTHCTNLVFLDLNNCHYSGKPDVYPKDTGAFKNLEELDFNYAGHGFNRQAFVLDEAQFLYMTSEAKALKKLNVDCDWLFKRDSFWTTYLSDINGLSELEKLVLTSDYKAPELTAQTVEAFLSACPKLRNFRGPIDWVEVEDHKEIGKRLSGKNYDFLFG